MWFLRITFKSYMNHFNALSLLKKATIVYSQFMYKTHLWLSSSFKFLGSMPMKSFTLVWCTLLWQLDVNKIYIPGKVNSNVKELNLECRTKCYQCFLCNIFTVSIIYLMHLLINKTNKNKACLVVYFYANSKRLESWTISLIL